MMNKIVINLDAFDNIKEFHLWLKYECDFPDYYGCNLDALYDCLSEYPVFEFEIVDSDKYENYQSKLIDTIQDAGCSVSVVDKNQNNE